MKQAKPPGYWTYERCKNEAKKYTSRTDFCNLACGAYTSALKHGWLDEICGHMHVKWQKKWASKEICKIEAQKYKNRSEFQKKCVGAYTYAMRHGFLDEICQHMDYLWKEKWSDKNACAKEARKYNRRIDFAKGSNSAYTYAMKHGFLDDICTHMQSYVDVDTTNSDKKRVEYVKERLQVTPEEWENIYNKFLKNKGKVLIANRIQHKRCIYAAEFEDHFVYIGLANNLKNRIKQHITSPQSQVFKHIKSSGLYPTFSIKRDFTPQDIAQTLEGEVLEEYKKNGWIILNQAKTGSLGGSTLFWTYERCIEVAKYCNSKAYFSQNFSGAYASTIRGGWMKDIETIIAKNLIATKRIQSEKEEKSKKYLSQLPKDRKNKYWTYETISKEAKKYKTKKEFKEKANGAYTTAVKRGLLNEICSHMKPLMHKSVDGIYWTKDRCAERAILYSSKMEFKNNDGSAYTTAVREGWLEEICNHMPPYEHNPLKWTKRACHEVALQYKTKKDFKKGNYSAYTTAGYRKWIDDICGHMIPLKKGKK